MHNEPGIGYVISELKQKKVEKKKKIENWTINEKEHRNRKETWKKMTIGRENLIKQTILEQGNREIHYNTK